VQLGGTTAPIAWGAPYFVPDGQELRFGHYLLGGTIRWDRPLNLGGGNRTIRLEAQNPASTVLLMNQPLLGGWGGLNIVGSGTMDIIKANPSFGGVSNSAVNLFGTTLRLSSEGSFGDSPIDFTLRHGGKLWLRNSTTAHNDDRIHDLSNLTLEGGELRFDTTAVAKSSPDLIEQFGALKLPGFAANKIVLNTRDFSADYNFKSDQLAFSSLVRDATFGRSTLDVSGLDYVLIQSNTGEPQTRPNDASSFFGGGVFFHQNLNLNLKGMATGIDYYEWFPTQFAILPWATADGKYWLTAFSYLYSIPEADYHTADQSTWGDQSGLHFYNVSTNGSSGILTGNRYINSLRLTGGTLNLGNNMLNLYSGGLLTTKADQGNSFWTITGGNGATITTAQRYFDEDNDPFFENPMWKAGNPLYMHIYSDRLQIAGGVSISTLGADIVKTGPGELWLNSASNHQIGSLYINQGTVDLRQGTLTLSGADARIYIGDGAGKDILKLAPHRRNQIQKQGGGLPSITLQGTPYAPRGPEYGGDQAILQMGGNTKLQLKNLHIEGRGTIDWVGGEVGQANILWLDSITFSGPDAILFMRNWYEYEDFLLVRQWGLSNLDIDLQRIRFEGYENYTVIIRKYDAHYWQITPFGTFTPFPEPTTTGAILGAVGIGLWGWRCRRKTGK